MNPCQTCCIFVPNKKRGTMAVPWPQSCKKWKAGFWSRSSAGFTSTKSFTWSVFEKSSIEKGMLHLYIQVSRTVVDTRSFMIIGPCGKKKSHLSVDCKSKFQNFSFCKWLLRLRLPLLIYYVKLRGLEMWWFASTFAS